MLSAVTALRALFGTNVNTGSAIGLCEFERGGNTWTVQIITSVGDPDGWVLQFRRNGAPVFGGLLGEAGCHVSQWIACLDDVSNENTQGRCDIPWLGRVMFRFLGKGLASGRVVRVTYAAGRSIQSSNTYWIARVRGWTCPWVCIVHQDHIGPIKEMETGRFYVCGAGYSQKSTIHVRMLRLSIPECKLVAKSLRAWQASHH